jgi:hypothetical protein
MGYYSLDVRVWSLQCRIAKLLHGLIESLPDASLETAERVLRNYQKWPPLGKADFGEFKQRVTERFEKMQRERAERTGRGMVGGFAGGGHSTPDGDGAASMTGWDGRTLVKVEMRVFKGHKMEMEERFCLSDDQQAIQYSQKVKGPTGTEHSHEVRIDVIQGS